MYSSAENWLAPEASFRRTLSFARIDVVERPTLADPHRLLLLVADRLHCIAAGRGFRLNPNTHPLRKYQKTSLRTRVLDRVRISVSISFSSRISPDTA